MDISENILAEEKIIMELMGTINDPEIPVISIVDLGIIRSVKIESIFPEVEGIITITPTYSGCPAMDVIRTEIEKTLLEKGYKKVEIISSLSPAWTTDWMSEEGKQKLKAYGIAPPLGQEQVCTPDIFQENRAIECPQCHSMHTRMVSKFGSTPCKSLYQCEDCKEPFDYFKCH